jgi:hypothetical protein
VPNNKPETIASTLLLNSSGTNRQHFSKASFSLAEILLAIGTYNLSLYQSDKTYMLSFSAK